MIYISAVITNLVCVYYFTEDSFLPFMALIELCGRYLLSTTISHISYLVSKNLYVLLSIYYVKIEIHSHTHIHVHTQQLADRSSMVGPAVVLAPAVQQTPLLVVDPPPLIQHSVRWG